MNLSQAQRDELAYVFPAAPDHVEARRREPERFVQMVMRKPTLDALEKRGLCGHVWRDWPDGWWAELTPEGLRARAQVLAERQAGAA